MSVLIGMLTAIHVLVALALIGLVLMQKSSDQGVGAAFGGGVTDTVFGAGTTTALVRMTIWCACMLLGTTLLLAILHTRRGGNESLMQKAIQAMPVQTAPAASQAATACDAKSLDVPSPLDVPSDPHAVTVVLPDAQSRVA